ncbi:MAG TPA: transaldolase, partial [Terriglobales bacterium]
IAESTGKIGKGLIPVDREALAGPAKYGDDRVFAYIRLKSDRGMDTMINALADAGQPVLTIEIDDVYDIAGEYFRWEIATAVAGSILGINPFDQPDVEASKIATRALTTEYEQKGSLPQEHPFFESDGIKLYADEHNATDLQKAVKDKSLAGYLRAHLERMRANDYFAILAYIQMNEEHEDELQYLRHCVRDTKKNATCLGFGPRFLHSTGQAYKGGPNSGVFLQLTCDHAQDLPVPGQKYTFGIVESAQARGDFQVLADRQRRALRVHLPAHVDRALQTLSAAVQSALNP